MCTAYEIGKKGNRVPAPARLKSEARNILSGLESGMIIRPTLSAPVILPDGTHKEMSWGFRREFAGKAPGKKITRTIVNSREDKLSSFTWRDAFQERRCLIPVSSFFEWTESPEGKALPLRFAAKDGDMIWIAGIWEEGESGECYSMITTEPNDLVRPVHDRMPAVLLDEQINPFLDGELHKFGPSGVMLEYSQAENFLTRKPEKKPPPEEQGSLF